MDLIFSDQHSIPLLYGISNTHAKVDLCHLSKVYIRVGSSENKVLLVDKQ